MKAKTQTTEFDPVTFAVFRDGEIDDEYYDAIYAEKRREALHEAGRELVGHVLRAPVVIGKGLVWLMVHDRDTVVG